MDKQERIKDRANRQCKGCGEEYNVTAKQIERFIAALASHPEQCVTESIYQKRLSMCAECPHLIQGHTCTLCGCIVQIRAKLKNNRCPLPDSAGWQPVMEKEEA